MVLTRPSLLREVIVGEKRPFDRIQPTGVLEDVHHSLTRSEVFDSHTVHDSRPSVPFHRRVRKYACTLATPWIVVSHILECRMPHVNGGSRRINDQCLIILEGDECMYDQPTADQTCTRSA